MPILASYMEGCVSIGILWSGGEGRGEKGRGGERGRREERELYTYSKVCVYHQLTVTSTCSPLCSIAISSSVRPLHATQCNCMEGAQFTLPPLSLFTSVTHSSQALVIMLTNICSSLHQLLHTPLMPIHEYRERLEWALYTAVPLSSHPFLAAKWSAVTPILSCRLTLAPLFSRNPTHSAAPVLHIHTPCAVA